MLSPIRPWLFAFLAAVAVVLDVVAQATVKPHLFQSRQTAGLWGPFLSELRRVDPSGKAERELLSAMQEGGGHRESFLKEAQFEYLECIALGRLLHTAFNTEQPLIAVNPAGCLPYNSRLPALDMLGLNDSYIAHHRPPDMGHGALGHELGDGAYVLSRKPDLLIFCNFGEIFGVTIPCNRNERQIADSPEFVKHYRLIRYRAGEFELLAWTRIEEGRLAIKRAEERVDIPGFLLATTSGADAILDSTGKLVTSLQEGDARIENIDLPSGTWEVSLQTDEVSDLHLTTLPASGGTILGARTLRVVSRGEPRSFRVSGARGLIYGIIARRVRGEPTASS